MRNRKGLPSSRDRVQSVSRLASLGVGNDTLPCRFIREREVVLKLKPVFRVELFSIGLGYLSYYRDTIVLDFL